MNSPTPIVVANLKANLSWEEIKLWLNEVSAASLNFKGTIIFCPSYPFLVSTKDKIGKERINIKLGAQDISRFKQGAYTGEVAAAQIADIVEFAIIGHSERRKYFGETNEDVLKEVGLALQNNITPILCISDMSQLDDYLRSSDVLKGNSKQIIFVYEPPSAISGGKDYKPDDPNDANENAKRIKEKIGTEITIIYGGSINPENVASFFTQKNIDGGLVGQASVDPDTFLKLLKNATI